jgi:L-threonylcarbamoyladenylate synthase
MRRVVVDADRPDPAVIQEAVRVIRSGGIVALPTDTLYGLAVDPFQDEAVARIFVVKGRTLERALPLIAADAEQVGRSIGPLTPIGQRLAACFWPGPLTLVMPAPSALAAVTGGTGTVGVRVPAHPVARALCRAYGSPLTATSANRSGSPPAASPNEVERALGGNIELLVDGGVTKGGAPSTIVDTTGSQPRLVRTGAVPWPEIEACLQT